MSVSSLPFLSFFLSGALALDKTPALWDETSEKATSYGDLRDSLKKLAPYWRGPAAGQERRALVLCALPRTVQGTIAMLSATLAGHALLFVDSDALRLAPFLAAYEPEWVVSTSILKPGDCYDLVEWPLDSLTLWHRASPSPLTIHPDLLYLFLPPGPEGSVKTVRLSYNNIASNLIASAEALHVSSEDRALLHLPLSYSFGFSVLALMLGAGGSVFLTEQDIKSRPFWEQAVEREVTLFPGTPFHFDYIVKAGLEHLHVPRIKTFWQAGGRMPPERVTDLLRQITERKGTFFILFGQVEASPRIAILPLHEYPEKCGSSGRVLRGGHFEFKEEELIYHGPNVMMGYAHSRADLTRGNEMKDELATGEHGAIDEDGFLFLNGK